MAELSRLDRLGKRPAPKPFGGLRIHEGHRELPVLSIFRLLGVSLSRIRSKSEGTRALCAVAAVVSSCPSGRPG
jgi:hypothetical protein